jgi:hypothetical protein
LGCEEGRKEEEGRKKCSSSKGAGAQTNERTKERNKENKRRKGRRMAIGLPG